MNQFIFSKFQVKYISKCFIFTDEYLLNDWASFAPTNLYNELMACRLFDYFPVFTCQP